MRTYFLPVLLLAAVAGLARSQPAVGVRPPSDVSTKEPPITGFRPVSYSEGPSPIQIAPVVPPVFLLLADPTVQQEIALRGDQKTAADRVRLGWSVPARGLYLGRFGKVPADSLRAATNARTADFLAKGLTKEQRTRLDQILFQLREKEFGSHQALVMAARDLGLRGDQMEDVRTLKSLRVEEIDKSVTGGKRFEQVKLEVLATNGDTFDRMAEMLTRAQRELLRELRGKPFEGKFNPSAPVEAGPGRRYPAPQYGLYDLELGYLFSKEVGRELKMTEDQGDRVFRTWRSFREMIDSGMIARGREDTAHELTASALERILTAEQRTRFHQLMMQRRAGIGPEAVCSYPAAVAQLKLSPVQVQQLAGGKLLADVLTRDQLGQYGKFMGEAFTLPAVSDRYVPRAPAAVVAPTTYAQARDFLRLTERLGLNADQIKKLRELAEDEPRIRELIHKELSLEDTPPVAGSGRALTSERAVTERYRAAVEQQCWDTLDPAQQSIARKLFGRGR